MITNKYLTIVLGFMGMVLLVFPVHAKKSLDVFPVPVWEARPDKGNSYGLMPVLLFSDNSTNVIETILAVLGQYNSVTQFDGAVIANHYPSAESELLFYGGVSKKYQREFSLRFFDPHLFNNKIFMEHDLIFLQSPFGHFFGIGPQTLESNRSNYSSRSFRADFKTGYYLKQYLRANYQWGFHTTDLQTGVMTQYADTLTVYGGLPNVFSSTNILHRLSLAFDTRNNREYSATGLFAELGYFGSNKNLGSDRSFQGWELEAIKLKQLKSFWQVACYFDFQEIFGSDVPFYELSSIGGPLAMRAFTPGRFVDQGRIIFGLEQRFRVLNYQVMGVPFEVHVDPFVEAGSVFQSIDTLKREDWEFVGGLGLRAFVPPNVVGRLDFSFGSDGFNIYTALGYPF